MFCPECGLDYEEGSTLCTDCDVPLVDEPEEEEAGGSAEFVPIVEVTDVVAFAVITARLEEEGIPWFIQSEPPLDHAAGNGSAVAMIYVGENHLSRALRIVDEASLVAAGEKVV